MSKKETEFDRVQRMKKMEREAEVEKRRSVGSFYDGRNKKGGKSKITPEDDEKDWLKSYNSVVEEEYDYV